MNIPLYRPFLADDVKTQIGRVLDSRWLGYGKSSMALETKFIDRWGGFALATHSCTSALRLVASTIQQTKTDEVIVPAITFVSTGMAFLNAGYKVLVADVDEHGLLDINCVRNLITTHTRAIVSVHLYGQKADLRELRELCDVTGIYLVEDCAHRIGYGDAQRYGDFACFSFNTMKELPSGEGGIVWGKDVAFEAKLREIANVGLGENTYQRASSAKHLNYTFGSNVGLKYMQNDIIAAMTLAQFAQYDENIQKRRRIFRAYDEVLKTKAYATLFPRGADDSCLMYVVKIRKEQVADFRAFLAERGVATSHHYPSLAEHPLFYAPLDCEIANHMQYELVTLPCYVDMQAEEQRYVLDVIEAYGQ